MTTTTQDIKLNVQTRNRLKAAAGVLDRTPHWLMRLAILLVIEKVESGAEIGDFISAETLAADALRHSVALRSEK